MTEILCRVDRSNSSPVVFIADTVDYDKHTVQAWTKGDAQTVSLNYYHQTGPLSSSDEEILRQRYARAFNNPDVVVRHRLPRTVKVLENILAKPGRPRINHVELTSVEKAIQKAPELPPEPQHTAVATVAPTPQELLAAIEQMRIETAQQIANAMHNLNAAIGAVPKRQRAAPAKQARASRKQVVAEASRKPAAKRIPTKV
jgi:hypothetical protein